MKFGLGMIVICLVLIGCGEGAELSVIKQASLTDEVDSLNNTHIVFYNVENLFDTKNDPEKYDDQYLPTSDKRWTRERYSHKLEQLAKAISWTGDRHPVLVGLAEVETEQCVVDLARSGKLKKGGYDHVHFDSPDERGMDVALLYRRKHFRVVHKEPIGIKLENDKTRDILYVHGQLGGEDMHVFVCHWSSRGEGVNRTEPKRIAAALVVRAAIDEILHDDPNGNILIMGDLNDFPTNKSVRRILAADCNDGRENGHLVDLVCAEHQIGRGSYNYKGDWGYLDHMIVSAGMLNTAGFVVGEAKAFFDDRLLFDHPQFGKSPDRTYTGRKYHGGFSDHLPVVLVLSR